MEKMVNPNQKKYDYLLQRNEGHMNDVALSFGERKITYEELHDRINKYAQMLYKKGIREGDKIGLCCLNTPESVYLIYALDIIGAEIIGFSPLENKTKIKQDIELTRPKMIITVDACYSNFRDYQKALNFSTMLYSLVESVDDKKFKAIYNIANTLKGNFKLDRDSNLRHLLRDESIIEVPKAVYQEGITSDIIFTGGSTGTHKGVELTGEGLNNLIEGMRYMYNPDFFTGKTYLGNIPFGHMCFGRAILHIALTNNMNFALTLKAFPKDFYGEIVRTHAECAVGGPPHWGSLVERKGDILVPRSDLKPGSLSQLQLATSGGEAMKTEVELAVNDALEYCGSQTPLGDGLGATEGWSVVTLNSGKIYRPHMIGMPLSNLKVKLINPATGKEVQDGEKGVLYISGPTVMKGYYKNPEETAKVISYDEDGTKWCSLGDYLIKDGTYKYVGREKRNFVCRVDNIYPEMLEELISNMSEVKDIVVTPIPDIEQQYIPSYHILLEDNNINIKKFEEKLRKLVFEKLGDPWLPQRIEYLTEPLKRMGNTKVDITYYKERDQILYMGKTKTK